MRRMELRHLRYFIAIAEHEHIGRAARMLHVSSSPLSRQMHQLEEEIGVRLLARVGRRVQLTDAGKVFHQEARDALARIDRAVASAQAASRGELGRLRIAFVEANRIAEMIPTAVRQFRARHPHIALELLPMRLHEQIEAFDAGRIDALGIDGLLTFRGARELPGFNVETLFAERMHLMVARDHALARKKRVTARDLTGVPIIWLPRDGSPFYYDLLRTALHEHGVQPEFVLETASTIARLSLVASGMGVTFALPSESCKGVVARPVADLRVDVVGVLLSRRRVPPSSPLQTFRDILVATAQRNA
jgi:DNA-binding transcriptional LysR family regulator